MTQLPDWLVERAALDEVPPASRDRIARGDPRELAAQIAALRDADAAELARHPAGPAVAQIEARVAAEHRRLADDRRRRRLRGLGLATGAGAAAVAVVLVARLAADRPGPGALPTVVAQTVVGQDDGVRVKGPPRLLAFRQVGDQVERLAEDTVVRAGDVIQLRYNAGGQGYGMIASLDGAGVVTLHYPLREDAPPQATAVPRDTATLPHAYALDDAPGFERFFLLTANDPVDVGEALAALRTLARRDDRATALLELPTGVRQWSLRLRKPDRSSTHHESP